jgi:hypothetical protein
VALVQSHASINPAEFTASQFQVLYAGYMLQFAFSMFRAVPAIERMAADKQFESSAAQGSSPGAVDTDRHPVYYSFSASSDRFGPPLDFNEAQAAGSSRFSNAFNAAEAGYEKPVVQRCPKQIGPVPGFDRLAVNKNGAGHEQTIPKEKAGYNSGNLPAEAAK